MTPPSAVNRPCPDHRRQPGSGDSRGLSTPLVVLCSVCVCVLIQRHSRICFRLQPGEHVYVVILQRLGGWECVIGVQVGARPASFL